VAELASALRAAPADLVLLDLDLGAYGDTTPLVAPLVSDGMRVLVVTGSTDRLRIAAALEQGAIGYQEKGPGFAALLARTHAALAAQAPLDPPERVRLLDELARARRMRVREMAPFEQLTEREAEALRELARGRTVTDIADRWVVSPTTVRSHVRAVLAKLDVTSQLAAVGAAVRTGWFTG
jgi:DNA-binding NarL/FixJ family response regulator